MWATDQMINSIDETSSCAVTIYLNGRYGEEIIDGKFRYLRVWKLSGNTWKVIAGVGDHI
jgi:hypothetical protein